MVHHRSASIDGLLLTVPLIVADDAERHVPSPVTLVADPALVSELEPDEAEGLFQIAVVQSRKVVDYIRANFPSGGETGDEAYQAKIREHPENYAFSFDVDALPEPCPAPTLIVTGRQDSVAGYRDAWGILENYPRGTFVVLDRSGHFLEVEQEDLFHALAGEWLDRVEECVRWKRQAELRLARQSPAADVAPPPSQRHPFSGAVGRLSPQGIPSKEVLMT